VPGGFVFANFGDQRLYRCEVTGEPSRSETPLPVTPAPDEDATDQFADFALSPDGTEVWCVRERHSSGKVARAIVAVPLDGSAANDPSAIRVLVTGSDFYAYPTPSPDGTRLAWICWDHPRMPWDGTELRFAAIDDALPVDKGKQQLVMGGDAESVLAPVWRDDLSLYVISDRSGWWNLYLAELTGSVHALCAREEEFATPLWQLGMMPYAVLGDGRIVVGHGIGEVQLGVLDPDTGRLVDLDLPDQLSLSWQSSSGQTLSAAGQTVATIVGGATVPMSVIKFDIGTGNVGPEVTRVCKLTRTSGSLPDAAYLPVPRAAELTGPSGSVVHALVYPPANPDYRGPDGELPPYVVWVHGGPTTHVFPRLDLEKAFFTSRGIGVIDVNYGGSTGYGRAYRERLRGQWGIVDVTDAMGAALALADADEADRKRLGIRGGSAGGWTALAAVTSGVGLAAGAGAPGEVIQAGGEESKVFAAATSLFGVSDLRGFVEQTHDFESRYLDGLIGPLPECEALYVERAPVGHVNAGTCPVLLLQGLEDLIVPPAQAESIAADLASFGIPYAYIAFEGEQHGFRKAENVEAALEAELSFYGQVMGFTPPEIAPIRMTGGSLKLLMARGADPGIT
jgi:dipeptidyl aminopeptidase/acylaminoacyl peptidase